MGGSNRSSASFREEDKSLHAGYACRTTYRLRYSDAHVISRMGLAVSTVPKRTTDRPTNVSALICASHRCGIRASHVRSQYVNLHKQPIFYLVQPSRRRSRSSTSKSMPLHLKMASICFSFFPSNPLIAHMLLAYLHFNSHPTAPFQRPSPEPFAG